MILTARAILKMVIIMQIVMNMKLIILKIKQPVKPLVLHGKVVGNARLFI